MFGQRFIELIPNLSEEVEVRSYLSDDVIAAKLWQEETSTDPDWKEKENKFLSMTIELTTKLA